MSLSSPEGPSHQPGQLLDQPTLASPGAPVITDTARDRDDSDLSDVDLPLPLPQSSSPSPASLPGSRPHPTQHHHRPRVIHSTPIESSTSSPSSPANRHPRPARSPSLSSSDVSSIPPSSPLLDPMDVDDEDSLHVDDETRRRPTHDGSDSSNHSSGNDSDMSDYDHDGRGRSRVRRPRSSASSAASDASSDRSSVRLSSLSASPTATAKSGGGKQKHVSTAILSGGARDTHPGTPVRRRITSSSSSVSSVSSVGTLSSSSSRSPSPPPPPKPPLVASPARKQERFTPFPIHTRKDGDSASDDNDDGGASSSGDSDGPVGPGSRLGTAGGGARRVLPSSPDSPMDHKLPGMATAAIKQEPGQPSKPNAASSKTKKDTPKSARPAAISTTSAPRTAGAPARAPASAGDPNETPLTSPLLPKRRGSVQASTGAQPLTNVDARKDTSGRTRLFKAVSRGDVALVTSLVAAGANVNHKDHAGWTPLHEAVLARREPIVQLLLERGANPNAQGLHGNTPLHDADTEEYLPVARLLLKYGASVSVRNEDGVAPIENPDAEDEVSALLNAYAVLEDALLRRDRWGMTLLHRCCWELGQLPTTPPKVGAPKCNAAEWLSPSPELIQELVACRRVDVNVSDNAGWTPLHELVAQRRVPQVQLLLRHGADVNARGFRGMTPLHEAAKGKGHAELVRLLLDHGADPRAATDGPAGASTPIDLCNDPDLRRVMAEYPYRATRADEVRRQLLEEIARTSGGVHGDLQSGAGHTGPLAQVEMAETVLSDPGGGAAMDESKSERSRDDAASTSTHQHRSGASFGGGVGGDPRKMTREERLMASYIARIERQEQRKQQQQQQGGKSGEGSSGGAKRKKSSATSVDIGKAVEKALEKAAATEAGLAVGAKGSRGDSDRNARNSKSAAGASKSKPKDGAKKSSGVSGPASRDKANKHDAAKSGPSRSASSTIASKTQQPITDMSSSIAAAEMDQPSSRKRLKSTSTPTTTLDHTIRVDDLPQYCTTGDAVRVAKALNLPGVIPVLPKAILAASRAGHVELVRVVVDRLASAHSSGAANAAPNLVGGKSVLSVQQVVTAALHQAVKQEHVDVAGYLLSKGAKATARNRAGQTPIEQAKVLGNKVLVSLLEQAASGSSSGVGSLAPGAASGSGGARPGGAIDEDGMMVDEKMTVVVMKDAVVLATSSSKPSAKGSGTAGGKRKANAVKLEEDDLSDTDVDSDTAPPPPKKAKTAGSMARDRARGSSKQHPPSHATHHSSALLSSLGFKDPPAMHESSMPLSGRAGASSSHRTSARRNSSSSSATPLLPHAQVPPSAADRRRASLLEQGGESGGTSPEISVVDSPRRTPPTIGSLSSSAGDPILAIQFGTRFLVLEPDVRGHVAVPSAGQVFRAPSQREIFALMDSPAAPSLRPGLPPPRVAMLDELIAAVHAAGAGPLPVQFTSWRPPASSTPASPPKRIPRAFGSGSGKQTSPRNQVAIRRPGEQVLPPKVMFKHMHRRPGKSSTSAK